jgi:hypothetical protein
MTAQARNAPEPGIARSHEARVPQRMRIGNETMRSDSISGTFAN